MRMRVFWIPQIPFPPFLVEVESLEDGVKLLKVLGDYDSFLFEQRIRPEYSNAGVLQVFDETDDYDCPDGSWSDWCDDETGEDDPVQFLAEKQRSEFQDVNRHIDFVRHEESIRAELPGSSQRAYTKRQYTLGEDPGDQVQK